MESNKFLRICLLFLSTMMLAHSELRALEPTVANGGVVAPAAEKPSLGAASNQTAHRTTPPTVRRVSTVRVDQETGRLVRVRTGTGSLTNKSSAPVGAAIRAARRAAENTPSVDRTEIRELIDETSRKHGVNPRLVHSIVRVESNYEQKAISPKGALGLMQLIPATARRYGVENPFDASQNIEGGVRYLKSLTERFQGNLSLALAAYNAGEGAVERHGGIPPYPETREYVRKVTRNLDGGSQGNAAPAPSLGAAEASRSGGQESAAANSEFAHESRIAASRNAAVRMYIDSEGRLHLESIQ
ncbi:MAG: lytic transglycosylase domain-containing protein [Bryobacterales bacterium]|nr:lytic transglycosylase domain-containing protein [Bryobacterales bacterium]